MAAFVKKYDLDGVDVDYEDFNAFDAGDGSSEVPLKHFWTYCYYQKSHLGMAHKIHGTA